MRIPPIVAVCSFGPEGRQAGKCLRRKSKDSFDSSGPEKTNNTGSGGFCRISEVTPQFQRYSNRGLLCNTTLN